jgi:hypothetical protein
MHKKTTVGFPLPYGTATSAGARERGCSDGRTITSAMLYGFPSWSGSSRAGAGLPISGWGVMGEAEAWNVDET